MATPREQINIGEAPIQLVEVFPGIMHAQRTSISSDSPLEEEPQISLAGHNAMVQDNLCLSELKTVISFKSEPPPFEAEISIVGLFRAVDPSQITQSVLLQFVRDNAWRMLLPFLRALVLDVTMRMQVAPILLPLMIPAQIQSEDIQQEALDLQDASEESEMGKPPYRSRPQRQSKTTKD